MATHGPIQFLSVQVGAAVSRHAALEALWRGKVTTRLRDCRLRGWVKLCRQGMQHSGIRLTTCPRCVLLVDAGSQWYSVEVCGCGTEWHTHWAHTYGAVLTHTAEWGVPYRFMSTTTPTLSSLTASSNMSSLTRTTRLAVSGFICESCWTCWSPYPTGWMW